MRFQNRDWLFICKFPTETKFGKTPEFFSYQKLFGEKIRFSHYILNL